MLTQGTAALQLGNVNAATAAAAAMAPAGANTNGSNMEVDPPTDEDLLNGLDTHIRKRCTLAVIRTYNQLEPDAEVGTSTSANWSSTTNKRRRRQPRPSRIMVGHGFGYQLAEEEEIYPLEECAKEEEMKQVGNLNKELLSMDDDESAWLMANPSRVEPEPPQAYHPLQ